MRTHGRFVAVLLVALLIGGLGAFAPDLARAASPSPETSSAPASPLPSEPVATPSPTPEPAPSSQPAPEPTATIPPEPSATPDPTTAPAPSPTPAELTDPFPLPTGEPVEIPDPATDRELVDRRTETSRTFDLGAGSLVTELFSEAVFYRPEDGAAYEPIELAFRPAGDAVVVDRSPVSVRVGAPGDEVGVLRLTGADGFELAWTPLVAGQLPAVLGAPPVPAGPVADVASVFPDADLRVVARADGANAFLVLDRAPLLAAWTFVLDLPAGSRLVPDERGGLEVRDGERTVKARIAAPYAVDSTPDELTGSGRTTSALHYTIGTALDGRPTVTVSLDDAGWLREAVYPVYVDPSTTLVGPGSDSYGDTFVNEGNAGQNYANYQRPDSPYFYEIWLGTSPSNATYKNHALIKFDVGTLAGMAIDGAELQVRPYHAYYDPPTERGVWVRRIGSLWTESGVNWTSRPTRTTNAQSDICAESASLSCLVDTTYWVQTWIDGLNTNHGFWLDTDGNNETYWKRLISAEQAHSTSPRLYVSYHDPVTAVAPLGAAWTNSRMLDWSFSGHSPQITYRVDVSTSAAFSSILTTSNDVSSAATTWSIGTGTTLTNGTTYYWRVKVKFGTASAWSPYATGSFRWDAAAPTGAITTPELNRPLGGIIAVTGSAGDGHSFKNYELEYGAGTAPATWTSLGLVTRAVSDGTLDTWPTGALASGVYSLRLVVRDTAGNSTTLTSRQVYLDNSRRTDDAYHSRIPFDLGGGYNLGIGVANGEATLDRQLFSIPSFGPAQELALHYSSQEPSTAGRLGTGWVSNLTQYLSFESGFVVWHPAGGGIVPFGQVGAAWTPMAGHFETLTRGAGEDTITLTDQTRLVFENAVPGRLKRIENRFGKPLTLAWSTSSATATDASSRATTIAIDSGNSRITGVTDSAGRAWAFGYTGTGAASDLTSITDPDPDGAGPKTGHVTTLAYDAAHRLTTITRTRSRAASGTDTITWSVAYTSGKATGVTDPVNATVANTFTYNATSTVVGLLKEYSPVARNTSTYTYDSLGRVTSLVDPQGFTTSRTYDGASNTLTLTQPVEGETSYSYDAAGNVLSSTRPSAAGSLVTGYSYNATNDVTEEREADDDAASRVVTKYTHDTAGHLTSVTRNYRSPATGAPDENLTTSYSYTANDQLETETDPQGVVTKHGFDIYGNETSVVENCTSSGTTPPVPPASCTAGGTHDATTNVTRTSSYGTTVASGGPIGLPTSTTDPAGATTTFTYDVAGRQTSEAGPNGTTTRSYDEFGNELTVNEPGGRTTTRVFDAANRATTVTDPSGTTTTTYDAAGNVKTQSIGGTSESRTYDGQGRLLEEIIDPGTAPRLNLKTEYAYDGDGRQIAVLDPRGTVTRTFYDAAGQVTAVVANCTNAGTTLLGDPAWKTCLGTGTADGTWNVRTSYEYDLLGNKTKESAPNGRVTTYVYDDLNQLVSTTSNDVASPTAADEDLTTYYAYDDTGRQTAVRSPRDTRTSFVVTRYLYDDLGRLTSEIANCTNTGITSPPDPEWSTCTGVGTANAATNVVTEHTYDARGNRVKTVAPDPSATASGTGTVVTRFAHDAANRLCRVVDNSTQSDATFDALADRCSTAIGGTATSDVSTRYTYDPAGNLASMVDGRGNTTSYGYDAAGRMTTLTDALGKTLAWTYDGLGNRTRQDNRSLPIPLTGSVTWTYDAAGRMATRAANGVTVTYTYDDAGNQLSASDGTFTISSTYDRLNRVLTVDDEDAGTTADTSYSYSLTAPSWTDPTGSYLVGLDKFERPTSVDDPVSATAFAWTYRADGQPAAFGQPNGNTTTYGYDALGRETGRSTAAGATNRLSYTSAYNRAGQVVSATETVTTGAAAPTGYAYDKLGRLTGYTPPAGSATAYGWDAVPNRTSVQVGSDPAVTASYNAANRPTSPGYGSDADGRLTARPDAAGQTFEWDDLGRLKKVKNSTGSTTIATYTYDPLDRLRLADYGAAGRVRFRYVGRTTSAAQLIDDLTGAVTRNLGTGWTGERLLDWTGAGGDVRIYGTNAHHDVTWTASSAGAVSANGRYDPWGTLASVSGTLPDFRFQGSWYDGTTQLSWVVTRWYAPAQGRFISEDTLLGEPSRPASRHLYAYGEGEPVGRWDPDGRCIPIGWFALSCIPDGVAVIGSAAAVGWAALNLAYQSYQYLRTHPITLSSGNIATNAQQGAQFEDREITRLRNSGKFPIIVPHKYFWTPWGGRVLDACAYTSWYHYIYNGKQPLMCWEFKSSSSALKDYFYGYQYDKDVWLMTTYGFPIEVVWIAYIP